ncbi:hypothetical protein BGX38DRAFT_1213336 [Terfezia claveryi]|nr:hypothetical protein BGX38DRAFT_1213336 [Terfezia claveryi]
MLSKWKGGNSLGEGMSSNRREGHTGHSSRARRAYKSIAIKNKIEKHGLNIANGMFEATDA